MSAHRLSGPAIAAVAVFLLVAAHFALVLVSLAPVPPVPARVQLLGRAYVSPLFVQNWWLFAPDPPPVDRRVEARGLLVAGGETTVTAWRPITARVVAEVRRNRLSRHNAAWLAVLNATYALTSDLTVLRLRGGARELALRQYRELDRQPAPLVVLERAASALLEAEAGRPFDQVQVRILITPVPAFADRFAARLPATEELLFPPVPFMHDVAPWSLPDE